MSRLPSTVGGIASNFSMSWRIASVDSQGLNRASTSSNSSRNSMPASPPRFCLATSGGIAIQPIAAACATIGNCTDPASLIFSLDIGRQIGLREIVSLEQERLAGRLSQRVGEAVAEVQPGRMAAAAAEITIGGARDLCVLGGHHFDPYRGLGDDLVKAAAGDRVARSIDDDRGFQVIRRGEALCLPARRQRLGKTGSIRFGA